MGDGPRFDGRKVAVTGAGGFIGNAICREFVERGAEVVGLEINVESEDRVLATGATFATADAAADPDNEHGMATVIHGVGGADYVVHAAAHVREWGAMEDFVRVNVQGTRNVLDAAKSAGVERVVHISSVVVYGYDDPGEQDEDVFHRTYGIPYIDTKSASDALACRRGAVVIRPGDVYGPHSVPWVLRPLELAKAGQLSVPGKGDGVMLPLYIDDLVEAVVLGLLEGKAGRAYAAWDGEPVTFEDYFNRLADLVGGPHARRLPRPLLAVAAAAMEAAASIGGAPPAFSRNAITFIDRRGTVSTRRIRDELGWEPRVGLDEGMRRVEEWARAEGIM
ncbi:MAG TPA: SDR family NAD(P)-dependent oxidoreductase [Solirubrobacterales bacterium]|jgi:nucleoside-diphosphate-sugar epimerase|nr:SDR family NAD(P)-dependent oxidoreductase [Solirubrobacterales bacterium]